MLYCRNLAAHGQHNIGHSDNLLAAALVSGAIAVVAVLKIAKIFSRMITKVDYKKMVIAVIAFITIMVIILSGPLGLLVLLC